MCILYFDHCLWADANEADMSADLPESERKKFAAKAVRDIIKEM